jgi:alpha-amylase
MLTQDDIIYFVVTDRFANGDHDNDADVDPSNPHGYHGGDFMGIVERIPYLQNLGVTALWITPVFEQIHLPEYGKWGYHGYWPLDFEKVDPHLYRPKPGIPTGSKRYLKDLVDQLHAAR